MARKAICHTASSRLLLLMIFVLDDGSGDFVQELEGSMQVDRRGSSAMNMPLL